jgi:hypothetical protein
MAFMRVLVVEDEIRMAALLRRGLSEEGYGLPVVVVCGDLGPSAGILVFTVCRPTAGEDGLAVGWF